MVRGRHKRRRQLAEPAAGIKQTGIRIHLVTAMVLMIVASGLLFLNLRSNNLSETTFKFFATDPDVFQTFGWPVTFYRSGSFHNGAPGYSAIDRSGFAVWFMANFGILCAAGATMEYCIRRRARLEALHRR
jgi:hypothetical protein